MLLLNSAASLQILLCKGCNLQFHFQQVLVIIVSNPTKSGIMFTGVVGVAACRDVLQCGVSTHTYGRGTYGAMNQQQKGCCNPGPHRQVLYECWRELISSLFLCNPTRGMCCLFLGDCLLEGYCQRSEESGKICCYARGIDLWKKIKIRVAQINVDWDWSRREKCNNVQILKEYLHQKKRWISQHHARSLAMTNSVKLGGRKSSLFIWSWLSETCSCFWHIPFPPTKLQSKN